MNNNELSVLLALKKNGFKNQRLLASQTGFSLGNINKIVNQLVANELVDNDMSLTQKAESMFLTYKPEKAIILAAGYGMRMVPINLESPKGLLIIDDQTLIERIINQLQL